MSNLRQAAQQALEALTLLQGDIEWTSKSPTLKFVNSTVAALRAALAEPEQKVWCDCGDSIEPDSGAKCGNCVAGDSAEPEQEPDTDCHAQGICQRSGYSIAPTPRKPLTVFEIDAIAEHLDKTTIGWATHEFAAAIEKAHGIGEQHE